MDTFLDIALDDELRTSSRSSTAIMTRRRSDKSRLTYTSSHTDGGARPDKGTARTTAPAC